ncbi:hypothetical protein KY348_01465 [Candidatus Woesearchaeota archaeon]|nr:hypothetical protein [Candidatus Woesearchaeota archaeon]
MNYKNKIKQYGIPAATFILGAYMGVNATRPQTITRMYIDSDNTIDLIMKNKSGKQTVFLACEEWAKIVYKPLGQLKKEYKKSLKREYWKDVEKTHKKVDEVETESVIKKYNLLTEMDKRAKERKKLYKAKVKELNALKNKKSGFDYRNR